MAKTMQQQDHDAWEEGYGRDSKEVNQECNDLSLQAMYQALARRKAEKKGTEEESAQDADNRYSPHDEPKDGEARTMQQEDQEAWEWAQRNNLI